MTASSTTSFLLLLSLILLSFALAGMLACAQATQPIPGMTGCKAEFAAGTYADGSGVCGSVTGGGGAPPGSSFAAHGQCVTVTDPAGNGPISGNCDSAGNYRIPLQPGTYIVTAAGRRETVEVKPHQWMAINFFLAVPWANRPPVKSER